MTQKIEIEYDKGFPSLDECRCSCHRTGAIHAFPCCTGVSRDQLLQCDQPTLPTPQFGQFKL